MTVLIIILLLVLVLWAVGITLLYADMLRAVKKIIATNTDAIMPLFDNDTLLVQLVRESLDATEAMHKLVVEYRSVIDKEIEENRKNKAFAMATIQEARRIYNNIQTSMPVELTEEGEEEHAENE